MVLLLICLGVYLPGLWTLPPVDRDESRFAQASRQMAEADDWGRWLVPMVQDRPRLNKPPLIYWLQATAARGLGQRGGAAWTDGREIWAYRVPSVLAAIIAVLATWRIGVTMFDARAGWLAGLLLAVGPIMIWESKQARADMVLLAATTVAMWMAWSLFRRRRDDRRESRAGSAGRRFVKVIVLWIAVAAGVMTKGPITPWVLGVRVVRGALVWGRWGWVGRMRPVLGSLFVLAVLMAWVWKVSEQVGWSEYLRIVSDETLGRGVSAKEGHWGPPGYHLVLLPVLFWPGSLLTAAGFGRALRRGLRRGLSRTGRPGADPEAAPRRRFFPRAGRRGELFCLAWLVPSWIVFEIASTKLPHYTLPLYPPLALLSARAVLAAAAGSINTVECKRCKLGFVTWLLIGVMVAAVLPVALWWATSRTDEHMLLWWSIGAGLFAIVALLWAVRWLRKRRFVRVQLAGLAALAVAWPVTIGLVLPGLKEVWVSRELARVIARIDPTGDRPVAAVDYHEDSLIFLTHGRLNRIQEGDLTAWMAQHPDGIVIKPADAQVGGLRRLGEVTGFNYSKGKRVRLLVGDRAP